jgi:hypothetical protein
VTRPDGPDWLVEDGETVVTVAPRDSDALADAIGSLLDSPDYAARLAREGRSRAERAGWDAVVDAHIEVYERVVRGGRRRPSDRTVHAGNVVPGFRTDARAGRRGDRGAPAAIPARPRA